MAAGVARDVDVNAMGIVRVGLRAEQRWVCGDERIDDAVQPGANGDGVRCIGEWNPEGDTADAVDEWDCGEVVFGEHFAQEGCGLPNERPCSLARLDEDAREAQAIVIADEAGP